MTMLNRKQRNTGISCYEQTRETKTLKWLGKIEISFKFVINSIELDNKHSNPDRPPKTHYYSLVLEVWMDT